MEKQALTLKLDNGKITQEDKRKLITTILLASNRIFMENKVGPADHAEFNGKDLHFLIPQIKENNMMKSIKFLAIQNEDVQSFIRLYRTVSIKKVEPVADGEDKQSEPKTYEQVIDINLVYDEQSRGIIESSFMSQEIHERKMREMPKFENGAFLIPNGVMSNAFIYRKTMKLDPGTDYKVGTMNQLLRWTKKKGMNPVNTFSGLGGST